VANVSREQYDVVIRQVILFLEGKHEEVLADLRRQMDEASENLEFERAAALQDAHSMSPQAIVDTIYGWIHKPA